LNPHPNKIPGYATGLNEIALQPYKKNNGSDKNKRMEKRRIRRNKMWRSEKKTIKLCLL